jgi:hypothetical protein
MRTLQTSIVTINNALIVSCLLLFDYFALEVSLTTLWFCNSH